MSDPIPGRHVGRTSRRDGTTDGRRGTGAGERSSRAAHRSYTADLTGRVEALEQALAVACDRVTPGVRAGVEEAVAAVRSRLAVGVDHTLVALVGGTGSGKSSLFNAVCGLPLADVGVRRPTTSHVTACVWGGGAEPLLDWLGVAPDRRFERESVLDGDAEADLRGLVLLDLPDHDSVADAHRAVVDRLLPMVDLLVWVVDPQKYADDALHTGYLRGLVGQDATMVVVVNQMDTVPVDVRPGLAADVSRLLAEDGLAGVPVLPTSVATGEGVAGVRAALARVVGGPTTASLRAGGELAAAARRLVAEVGASEPGAGDLPTAPVVDALAHAGGLPATAAAVAEAVRDRRRPVPALGRVQTGAVELTRHRWVSDVGAGLPPAWQSALDERVPPAADLRRALEGALSGVPVSTRGSGAVTALKAVALVAAVTAVLLGVGMTGRARTDLAVFDGMAWLDGAAGVASALAGTAVVLFLVAAALRRRTGRERAEEVRAAGRSAVEGVVRTQLAEPSLAVLAEHRQVRELIAAAGVDAAVAGRGGTAVPGVPPPAAVAGEPSTR